MILVRFRLLVPFYLCNHIKFETSKDGSKTKCQTTFPQTMGIHSRSLARHSKEQKLTHALVSPFQLSSLPIRATFQKRRH